MKALTLEATLPTGVVSDLAALDSIGGPVLDTARSEQQPFRKDDNTVKEPPTTDSNGYTSAPLHHSTLPPRLELMEPSFSDSESEKDNGPNGGMTEILNKRKVQNIRFANWSVNFPVVSSLSMLMLTVRISQRTVKVTKEEAEAVIRNANDEDLSIRALMSKQESQVIINEPREYQLDLFEKAKQQNIIAVLDTGICSKRECPYSY